MTLKLLGILAVACCIFAGCRGAPITRAELVGNYIYKSEDSSSRATDHEWDHLTIQADGKYDLVQGGQTKPKTETVGTWALVSWGGIDNGPSISLGHAGYPIQVKGGQVRLLIDEDTGIWYVKVR